MGQWAPRPAWSPQTALAMMAVVHLFVRALRDLQICDDRRLVRICWAAALSHRASGLSLGQRRPIETAHFFPGNDVEIAPRPRASDRAVGRPRQSPRPSPRLFLPLDGDVASALTLPLTQLFVAQVYVHRDSFAQQVMPSSVVMLFTSKALPGVTVAPSRPWPATVCRCPGLLPVEGRLV